MLHTRLEGEGKEWVPHLCFMKRLEGKWEEGNTLHLSHKRLDEEETGPQVQLYYTQDLKRKGRGHYKYINKLHKA